MQALVTPLSVVIPTYGRNEVLVNTISALLAQPQRAAEILVIDQSAEHDEATQKQLERWNFAGEIRWIFQQPPSIPKAMNAGLLHARSELVLFLDDDIVPSDNLVGAHTSTHKENDVWAVVGQVLQPGQEPTSATSFPCSTGIDRDLQWPFNSATRREIVNCMAGNLSVRRAQVLAAGGFDENFVGVAYRFETEFARRIERQGGRILFEPTASIRHLRAGRGGTRSYGNHLASTSPVHSVGDYYFALRHGLSSAVVAYIMRRLFGSVITRHHLKRPWHIPSKMIGEFRGLLWAIRLVAEGPRYAQADAPVLNPDYASDRAQSPY